MKNLFVFIFLTTNINSFSQNEDQVLPDFLLSRTMNIRFAGGSATGFLHNDSSYSYLVTVRHIFQKQKVKKGKSGNYIVYDSMLVKNNSPITIELFAEDKWQSVAGTIHYYKIDSCNIDLAIFKFFKTGTWSSIYFSDPTNFFLGQHCYYAGYPLNLKTPVGKDMGYTFPIIKQALYSGIVNDTIGNYTALLLDGNNTFGLSGSPIFFYNYQLKKWRIGGLVTSYYLQKNKVFNSSTGKFEIQEENSGIIKGILSYDITKLINQIK